VRNKKLFTRILVTAAAAFAAAALAYTAGIFVRLDRLAYDSAARFLRTNRSPAEGVAVILIDDASLEALEPVAGEWPWPRAIYGDLLEFLTLGSPRAVVFDILFTARRKTAAGEGMDSHDARLAEATAEAGHVFHALQLFQDEEDEVNETLLDRPLPPDFVDSFALKPPDREGLPAAGNNNFYLPFRELYRSSFGMGVVDLDSDSDGVYRRVRLTRSYQGAHFPVLGLAPVLGDSDPAAGKGWMQVGGRRVPLDEDGRYLLNLYGAFQSFSMSGIFASLQKIRRGEVADLLVRPDEFRGKIVFVGATAVGVGDVKATALSPRTPGTYLHATIASNFLKGDFLRPPDRSVTLAMMCAWAFICAGGIAMLKPLPLKILTPVVIAAAVGAVYLAALRWNVLLEPFPVLAAPAAAAVFSFTHLLLEESRERRRIRGMFSQYVSPEMLEEIIEKRGENAASATGRSEELTILFTDIRDFTSFAENASPEKVVEALNVYFSRMSDVILDNKGTIDKFIGDAIMVFWGAPIRLDGHALFAVRTAMAMVKEVPRVNEELRKRGIDFVVKIGIGIHTGQAVLGSVGSSRKLSYTAVGDAVNLASRLEGQCKIHGREIVLSEATCERLNGSIPCRLIDTVQVKGRREKTRIYEPVDTLAGG